jgi:hypothetical protein
MSKMYTQSEAEEKIKSLGNGQYELVGNYKGSTKLNTFRHIPCGREFVKRWYNFVYDFAEGSPQPKCPNCKS